MESTTPDEKTKDNTSTSTVSTPAVTSSSPPRIRNFRKPSQRGELNFGRSRFFSRKKECYFTKHHLHYIDYKDVNLLRSFLGRSGKILTPHFTGVKPKPQRRLAVAIKRARYMALLPFTGSVYFDSPRNEAARESLTKNFSKEKEVDQSPPKKELASSAAASLKAKPSQETHPSPPSSVRGQAEDSTTPPAPSSA